MSAPEEHLRRWQAAGLLDEATAARLREFESARHERTADERPGILEAVVYLGVAIAAVGVAILVGSAWGDLQDWARIAVVGVPAVLALLAGQALRSIGRPDMVRGGHVAWLLAEALLSGTAAVAADSAGWSEDDVALAAAIVAATSATALWLLAPSHVQVFGVGAGLFLLSMMLGTIPDEYTPLVAGLVAAAFGAALLALTELNWFRPTWSAQPVAALLLAWGVFFGSFDDPWAEAVAFIAAAALVVLSIGRGVFVYMVLGLALGFGALVRAIAMHVDDPTAASLALIMVGALLVGSVILLARHKPWREGPLPA
ncbi:MAG: DUF2157 domain-containing protein [Dehalococcoidia bacterium]|nr:DUF2157 domain-containing protein [Dehalococcoidia bacterium]